MKYVLGVLSTFLVLFLSFYACLQVFDIDLISQENLQKGLKVLLIIAITSTILVVIVPFFFKNNFKGYDKKKRSISHPKK